ncbi:MAG: GNAT family N-acetyltransferase [Daejeonella sp.]
MVKFVVTADVLPLRNIVLRDNKGIEFCHFDGDNDPATFHLAKEKDGIIYSVASFHDVNHPEINGKGWQLRGMATLPEFQGKGAGKAIVKFAAEHLKELNVDYIWCNARKNALPFYLSCGFEIISQEFQIEGIGPHYQMRLKI